MSDKNMYSLVNWWGNVAAMPFIERSLKLEIGHFDYIFLLNDKIGK